MKKSLIYTRTGDDGTTSLVGGRRVSKTDLRLEAYGTVDELNAQLGMLSALLPSEDEGKALLRFIQHRLFAVGAYLATDLSCTSLPAAGQVGADAVSRLETAIDRMDASLPRLEAFVLPGGSLAAAVCHVCRTVCRRAERRMLALEEAGVCPVDTHVKQFINRLSDFLFVLSRRLNILAHESEIFWDKGCK